MDLSKLKAFVVVAEELNFRKSAEVLGMSQPPLTRLISSLEEELAVKLFERTTRKVKLTAAGVYLLKEGREILTRAETLEKEVRGIGKIKTGELVIGFSAATFLAVLPKVIEEFRERFPKVNLTLHQLSRDAILKGLRSGKYDVCFIEGTFRAENLSAQVIRDESLGVLLPKRHTLAKKKELDLRELKNETIILHPRKESTEFFDTVKQLFSQAGIKPSTYIKGEAESCPILVATGKGVSLTIAGARNLVPAQTRFVPLKKLFLPVSAVWSPENANPHLKTFLSFVEESRSLRSKQPECLMDVLRL